jgi:hypothetical protein
VEEDGEYLHHDHHGNRSRSLKGNIAKNDDYSSNYAAYPEVLAQETIYLPVCTSWNKRKRGTREMMEECMQDSSRYGMFHPIKLSRYSAGEYMQWLDRLQTTPAI